ncbi:MAG: hypothetical protein OEY23_23990, partial [Acidimicrobiia bacterium]|nr:hypothetical protein [Acidimicrobiia bacterium]
MTSTLATTAPASAAFDPSAPLPDGCPDGRAALVDVRFSHGGTTVDRLDQIDPSNDDVIEMTWSGYADGCAASDGTPLIDVTLAVYAATSATFDLQENQQLAASATCGPDSSPCDNTDGRYRLAVTMPPMELSCTGQLDAVLGAALDVVGPNGSYYSSILRGTGPNRLIDSGSYDTLP